MSRSNGSALVPLFACQIHRKWGHDSDDWDAKSDNQSTHQSIATRSHHSPRTKETVCGWKETTGLNGSGPRTTLSHRPSIHHDLTCAAEAHHSSAFPGAQRFESPAHTRHWIGHVGRWFPDCGFHGLHLGGRLTGDELPLHRSADTEGRQHEIRNGS